MREMVLAQLPSYAGSSCSPAHLTWPRCESGHGAAALVVQLVATGEFLQFVRKCQFLCTASYFSVYPRRTGFSSACFRKGKMNCSSACTAEAWRTHMNKYFPNDTKPAVNAYKQGKCLRLIKASFGLFVSAYNQFDYNHHTTVISLILDCASSMFWSRGHKNYK